MATGYLLGLMTTIPLTGWASERFGLRRLWQAALRLFLIASVLCAAARSIDSLIAFRVLQGLAGGVVVPAAHAIVVRASDGSRLGAAMTTLNAPVLVAPVLGPTIGGLLIDGFDWRSMILINVPICAAALALAARALPHEDPQPLARLDARGFLLLSAGLVLLVYGLALAGEEQAGAAPVVSAGCGVGLLVAFAGHARLRGERALLGASPFTSRAFLTPAAIAVLFNFMLFGSTAVLPLYFEAVRGESAVAAGLLVAPQGIGSALGILLGGRLVDRHGPACVALAGVALALAGTLVYARLGAGTPYVALVVALLVRGGGPERDDDRRLRPRPTGAWTAAPCPTRPPRSTSSPD